jgi:hypothetical protein
MAGRGAPGRRSGAAKAEARKAPTVEELCKKFMEDYSKKRNKPSTRVGYQGVIDRCIIPLLGRKKVHDVKRPDIAGLMEKLAYKPTEANKAFSVLRKMFNLAEVGAIGLTAPIRAATSRCSLPARPPTSSATRTWASCSAARQDRGRRAGELRHPSGDPPAIRVRRPPLRNRHARMGMGRSGEPARGLARQQDRRHVQAHERGSLPAAFDGAAAGRQSLRPAVATTRPST